MPGGKRGASCRSVARTLLAHLQRVGVRQLIDAEQRHRLAVQAARARVVGGGQFDAGDVAQADDGAVRRRSCSDHVLEFLHAAQAPMHGDRVGHLLAGRRRLGADDAGRRDHVLLVDGAADVRGRDAQARHLARVEPDAHAVVARAELQHLADPLHARQRVVHLQRREVAEEQVVVARVSDASMATKISGCGWRLVMDTPWRSTSRRQLPLRNGDLILHIDGGDVLRGADFECDVEGVGPVVGAARVHVNHVGDAVHLRLDRRRHRLLDGRGVRAREGRRDHHRGRRDLREPRHRQQQEGDGARERDDDREHRREYRPVDEEIAHEPCAGSAAGFAASARAGWVRTGVAGLEFLRAVDDHDIAGREALLDHPVAACCWPIGRRAARPCRRCRRSRRSSCPAGPAPRAAAAAARSDPRASRPHPRILPACRNCFGFGTVRRSASVSVRRSTAASTKFIFGAPAYSLPSASRSRNWR